MELEIMSLLVLPQVSVFLFVLRSMSGVSTSTLSSQKSVFFLKFSIINTLFVPQTQDFLKFNNTRTRVFSPQCVRCLPKPSCH
mmetsp:Transcript_21779/g.52669  ORF Transcript_21779/g.52669 Transcript_21779/m.52669 type:complete len:83 (-) Transcript_21779:1086-1334(-)